MTPQEKRSELDQRMLDKLHKDIINACQRSLNYMKFCSTCRMISEAMVRETVGGINVYDYGMRRDGEKLFCPTCNRCVWDRT